MQRIAKMMVAATLLVSTTLIGISPIHAANAAQVTGVVTTEENHQKLIQDTLELATQGKTINSENFGIGSKGSAIKREWGVPDRGSDREWYFYWERLIYFKLDKDRVTNILSFDERLSDITLAEVKKIAGKPESEWKGEDGFYLDYTVGKYQLRFGFCYDNDGINPGTCKELIIQK
jgi:hypothetical protein